MPGKLAGRLEELRLRLGSTDPSILSARCGALFDQMDSSLHLTFFSRPVALSFPDLVIVDAQSKLPLPEATQVLLLYHLITADGTPLADRWLSFADLPDGRFYSRAFQGYTGAELVRHFGNDLAKFERAGNQLGGTKIVFGDAAFSFQILPRLRLAAIYHLGGEEFASNCQVLFNASASHYLPTDVCAILGSMLTQKLIAAE